MKKHLQKMTAFILGFTLLLTMSSISAGAVSVYSFKTAENSGLVPVGEILFSEDFEGTDTTASQLGASSANPLTVLKNPRDVNGALKILWINNVGEETHASTPYYILKSANAFKGEYTIEFNFNKTVPHSRGNKTDTIFFGAGYTDGTTENAAIKLGIDNENKPYYVDSSNVKQYFLTASPWNAGPNLGSYWTWDEGDWLNMTKNTATADFAKKTADWYNVKVRVNTQNAKYSVYLNGALVVKNASFIPCDGVNWSECGINLPYMLEADCNLGVRYVYDDLCIYRDTVGYESIWANDFNSYTESVTWNGNQNASNLTGVAQLGLSVQSGKGNSIKAENGTLTPVVNNSVSGALINGLYADENMVIEGDIKIPTFTDDDKYAPIIAITSNQVSGGFRYAAGKDGKVYHGNYNEGLSLQNAVTTITLGEVHHFELHMDFVNNTHDFYIDGLLVAEEKGNGRAGITNGGAVMVGLGYHQLVPNISVEYDNLKIYRDEREELFLAAADELKDIFPGTAYVMKEVILPTSVDGYEGYEIKWSADEGQNIAIGADGKTATVTQTHLRQTIPITATVKDSAGKYQIVRKVNVTVPAGPNVGINNDMQNKKVTATARQVPAGSVLIFAMYSGGNVIDVRMVDVSSSQNQAEIDYSQYSAGNYSAKGFLFESKNTLVPYGNVWGPVTIPVSE